MPSDENTTPQENENDSKQSRGNLFQRIRSNPDTALVIVCIAFFIDFLLLLSCIPIFPHYTEIFGLNHLQLGILFSTKSFAQLLSGPFMGAISDKLGRRIPMLVGLGVLSGSTFLFAFAGRYWILLIARFLQGMASSANSTAGMALLADVYEDPKERSKKMAYAIMSISFGVLLGSPFGGFAVQIGGPRLPFLIIASLVLLDGIARAIFLKDPPKQDVMTVYLHLITDIQILSVCGSIFLTNGMIAMMETTFSLFLTSRLGMKPVYVGLCYGSGTLIYSISVAVAGRFTHSHGVRWKGLAAGTVIMGVGALTILIIAKIGYILVIWMIIGIGIGLIDACSSPELAFIADSRHPNTYGRVFAVSSTANSLGFILGPVIGTSILAPLDYQLTWMCFGSVLVLSTPFLMLAFILKCATKRTTESKETGKNSEEPPPVVELTEEKESTTKMVVLEE